MVWVWHAVAWGCLGSNGVVVSLGRNMIKKLENLDLPNLRELWISYNKIEKLSGVPAPH